MKPTDIRNDTWAEIQNQLTEDRLEVYEALRRRHEPVTTRRLAEWMARDILSVRPRVTELCQLGLAELAGRQGREGTYVAVPLETVRRTLQGQDPHADQMALSFAQ